MPELPEVEVVRRGLADHVVGRTLLSVDVNHPRSVRRHLAGAPDLVARLTGSRVAGAHRRGKFLWLTFADQDDALMVHLGMSGQMLIRPSDTPRDKHAHIVAELGGTQLSFVDQRTFGGWWLDPMVEVDGTVVPESVAHIARDPFDPAFDPKAAAARLRSKRSEIKRVLLDQTAGLSGIGNIYADESLWRAKIHPSRAAGELSAAAARKLVDAAGEVMAEALAAGGTSFDSLYVNVNGNSGYFSRSLNAYGREEEPCGRCGAAIRREKFMNRSSYYCPRCQRPI
ncbi:bifunctional DNA-formamidopyrimidine glycosylase/DNA-(apurinic or apyrimidinic site) lyase [Nocardia stercoris]|uniref:Formamidopyrimidine-DNA glycosylase n=1 Tax=Nocardia stercoris TaxID=2483361 RepID=A0A3M2LEP3_9NOCA|nr:bifunctional DNA-formamidopyrimidine glycosylase/DNA-(apurinic or apyrimidinic site) lyase [Nocardia stercoris]RMI35536.1 bifunctional DNA-formamidopyrimidine glycosylase/DNA-(apurinic or apyrimidinic site) lyase [Nocardia stercoris]